MYRRSVLLVVALLVGCGGGATEAESKGARPEATPAATPSDVSPTAGPTPVDENPTATAVPAPTATALPVEQPTATPIPSNCWPIDVFDETTAGSWRVVLDGVMGGLSSGTAEVADGTMRISGTINTNGGGFVLVRRAIDAAELDGASQLRITGTTDGRTYEIIFEDGLGRDRSVSHFAPIRFDGGAPMTGEVSFADLEARTFGRTISTEAFRPDLVQTLGFIISDGVDGDFAITIERIEACA